LASQDEETRYDLGGLGELHMMSRLHGATGTPPLVQDRSSRRLYSFACHSAWWPM
jgi:hypothetical protein